jgi:hypothetical protein
MRTELSLKQPDGNEEPWRKFYTLHDAEIYLGATLSAFRDTDRAKYWSIAANVLIDVIDPVPAGDNGEILRRPTRIRLTWLDDEIREEHWKDVAREDAEEARKAAGL